MRREQFRPRAYERNHGEEIPRRRFTVGMSTRLIETPVVLDDEPVDPAKPPDQNPPPKPQPDPEPGPQPDPAGKPLLPHAPVPRKPRK